MSITYKLLNQYHCEYDAEELRKLDLLYEGGFDIRENAKEFIKQLPYETYEVYEYRLSYAFYTNYFSAITDFRRQNLFSKEISVRPKTKEGATSAPKLHSFYEEFSQNADNMGNSLADCIGDVYEIASAKPRAFIGIDLDMLDSTEMNRVDELNAARPYLINISPEEVINWAKDENGDYLWIVLKRRRSVQESPFSPKLEMEEFKVWMKEPSEGSSEPVISTQIFQFVLKNNQPPQDKAAPTFSSDKVTVSAPCIPILCLEFDKGMNLGNKIATLCEKIFIKRSNLEYAQSKSMFATLVYKQGPEFSANGDMSGMQEDTNRGARSINQDVLNRGGAVVGHQDSLEFIEPGGACYELINTELKEDTDELYRLANQSSASISNTSTAVGRSGESKAADNRNLEIVLEATGQVLRKFVRRIYDLVAAMRKEEIQWEVFGLSDFQVADPSDLMTQAMQANTLVFYSKEFKKLFYSQIYAGLLKNPSPEVMLLIQNEVAESVEDEKDDLHTVVDQMKENDGNDQEETQ